MKNIKKLAQDAIDVQDASNLVGVVISFSEALINLRQVFPNLSTKEINEHPIAVLYSSKIASLTHSDCQEVFSLAYFQVKEIIDSNEY